MGVGGSARLPRRDGPDDGVDDARRTKQATGVSPSPVEERGLSARRALSSNRRRSALGLAVGLGGLALVAGVIVLAANGSSRPGPASPGGGPYRGSEPPAGIQLPSFELTSYGEIVLHSPARNMHLIVQQNIQQLLLNHALIQNLGAVRGEKCLCVFPRNDYEPDVVFFGQAKAATFTPHTMKFPVPDLAVEVLSESTEHRDRGVKFDDYAAHGVAEYWIVDPEAEVVEQYLNRDGRFEMNLKSGSGELTSPTLGGLTLPLKAFFDPHENLAALQALVKIRPTG